MRGIGEEVIVRKDLEANKRYKNKDNDEKYTATARMLEYRGQKAVIEDYHYFMGVFKGYSLNIRPLAVFTDEMFEDVSDSGKEADELITHMLKLVPEQLINHSLDTKNEKLFKKLSLNSVDNR